MIELGQKVKDKVTDFTGIAIAKIEYMNGCVQFCVQPKKAAKDTKFPESQYIDIEQLDVVGNKPIKLNERKEPSGGIRCYPNQPQAL